MSQIVTKAPPRQILDSKRIPSMDAQEDDLNAELLNLEEGTRKRNREFKRRMDAIEQRQKTYKNVLKEETDRRDVEHEEVLRGIKEKLDRAVNAVETKVSERSERALMKTRILAMKCSNTKLTLFYPIRLAHSFSFRSSFIKNAHNLASLGADRGRL